MSLFKSPIEMARHYLGNGYRLYKSENNLVLHRGKPWTKYFLQHPCTYAIEIPLRTGRYLEKSGVTCAGIQWTGF